MGFFIRRVLVSFFFYLALPCLGLLSFSKDRICIGGFFVCAGVVEVGIFLGR